MKKRLLTIVFVIVSMLLCLCSCGLFGGDDTADSGKDDPKAFAGIYSPEKGATIVYDAGSVTEENLSLLEKHLASVTGNFIVKKHSSSAESNGEIILGKTSRELSKKAYGILERIECFNEVEVRYVIYSNGKSVAIAYDEAFYGAEAAQYEAITHFIEKLCTEDTLTLKEGIYAKEKISAIDSQSKLDEIAKNAEWEAACEELIKKYGSDFANEAIAALRKHYALFTREAVSWLADLYDPISGGFYYSNSARNTEGYLPDLESTTQALGLVQQSGMFESFDQNLKEGLPEWFCERVVSFVKGLQDPYNGYFYHPQWTRAASDANLARLGRDEQSAIRILGRFDAIPYYDTPSGTPGELEYCVTPASSTLTYRLDTSKVASVSKVRETSSDDSAVKEHLRSAAAFRSYLDDLNDNMEKDAYWTGNQLESQAAQIVARDKVLAERGEDYRLADILADWLTSKQDTTTGLWSPVGQKNNYEHINSLLKISSTYSRIGKPIPNAELGLKSAIDAVTSEAAIHHVCDILNPWYAIITLTNNISGYSKDTGALEEIKRTLTENFPEAVGATTEKLSLLLRPDGSFGYLIESSSPTSQEMPVAVPDSYEGDVNASMIAILSIEQHMFSTLGLKYIGPYSEAERLLFVSKLEDMGAIIKDDVGPAETLTFDDEQIGYASSKVVTDIKSSSTATVEIDPEDPRNQVLLINHFSGATENVIFTNTKKLVRGTLYICDMDVCISSESRNGDIAQFIMTSGLFMLNITTNHDTGKVIINESSSTNGSNAAIYKIGEVADLDEWFNLRTEYYIGNDDTVRIKVFVDGKLLVISDNYYNGSGDKLKGAGTPGDSYDNSKFILFSGCRSKIYVDNVLIEQANIEYEPPKDAKDEPLLRGVDAPDSEPTVYGFEDGALPETITASGARISETNIGNALLFSAKNHTVALNAPTRGYGSNAAHLEAKVFVPESASVGETLSFEFLNYGGGDELMTRVNLVVRQDAQGKYLTVVDGIEAEPIGDSRIPLGKAFKLRIDYFFKKSITAIYVDDVLSGATFTSARGSTAKYFSKVKIYSATAGSFALDDLVAERTNLPLLSDGYRIENDFAFGFGAAIATPGVVIKNKTADFAGAGIGDSLTFPVNNRISVPQTFTAELSLSIANAFKERGSFRIELLDKKEQVMLAYDVVGEEGLIKVYSVTENGRYTETPVAVTDVLNELTLKFSKRLEVAILYLDGICKSTTDISYSDGALTLDYAFVKVSSLDSNSDFAVISCIAESSIQDFLIDRPSLKKTEVLDYENNSSVDLPSPIIGNFISSGGEIKVVETINDGGQLKVLYVKTAANGEDTLTVSPTKMPDGMPTIVGFESDLLIRSSSGKSVFFIDPVSGSSPAVRLTLTATKGGNVVLSGADIDDTVISKEGEWFTLRMEYSAPGVDLDGNGRIDIKLEIFVNGEEKPITTSYTPYSEFIINPAYLTALRFTSTEATDAVLLLDNTFVGEVPEKELPVGAPNTDPDFEFGEGGNTIGGDGNSDYNGWIGDTVLEWPPDIDGSDNEGGSGSGGEDDEDNTDDGSSDTGNSGSSSNTTGSPNTDPDYEFGESGEVIGSGGNSDGGAWAK